MDGLMGQKSTIYPKEKALGKKPKAFIFTFYFFINQ
jgi:hypothetical protein